MATASPDLHDTSPAAAPYQLPPKQLQNLIRYGGAVLAAAAVAFIPVLLGVPVLAVHGAIALIALAGIGAYIARVDLACRRIPNWSVGALGTINVAAMAGVWAATALPHDGRPGQLNEATGHLLDVGVISLAALACMLVLHFIGGTGMGDVKLVFVCAFALALHGPGAVVLGVLTSYVLAVPVAAVPALLRGERKSRVPMAPYLVAGHALALLGTLAGALAS